MKARVFTIPTGVPFLDALAAGIARDAGDDRLALSRALVLLPTRRACRALRDAFLRRSGGQPTLLPRLQPIGDVDDDELAIAAGEGGFDLPPAISPLRRRLVLARAILALDQSDLTPPRAVELAAELAHFLDQVQTEGADFDALEKLVPDDYAEHWRRTVQFLRILTAQWPKILDTEGVIDPAARRNQSLAALVAHWTAHPPADHVYAAGSTGSIPATAALLAVVAQLPHGHVVLPGLDKSLGDDSWKELDETHPQYGLRELLKELQIERRQVEDWPPEDAAPHIVARRKLLSMALLPAATTVGWRDAAALPPESARGMARIDCAHPQEEAQVIALLLREALETVGCTAALITPDRSLARRVAAELGRFGVTIDDSAGRPLATIPTMTFLRLIAAVVCEGVAPAPLLAALKHPLAAGGQSVGEFRTRARQLEMTVLRGPRPGPGFQSLVAALAAEKDDELAAWFDGLAQAAAEFARLAAGEAPPGELLRAHIAMAEAWAASDSETGAARLWATDNGAEAASFIAELADAARDFAPLQGAAYPSFFESCLAGRVVRPAWGGHPRLQILGPLEARLIAVDVAILGGLNEGTWPPEVAADPWMSRPMRSAFGLPAPERRVGLAAHDFVQACSAATVVLTRAERVEGAPTVPSRWLQRLDAVLHAAGLEKRLDRRPELRFWQARLDHQAPMPPAGPPAPRPPLAARPRRLSVTEIETWRRDPYVIYARHILNLKRLEPLDAQPGAADRGIKIHEALHKFVQDFPKALPVDALDRLIEIGRESFGPLLNRPTVWAFWWPRFTAIARWVVALEAERRRTIVPVIAEAKGTIEIAATYRPFKLNARADRIDRLPDGTLAIIDYKTGAVPKPAEVQAGYAPQLPLEAVIAQAGGFATVPPGTVSQLCYWKLGGGDPAGEEMPIESRGKVAVLPVAELVAEALAGLHRLIERFDDPATPYYARPVPDQALRYNDYAHLARIKEWSAEDGS
jgi:ATP-dependent helicase/nuclease subunit B